MRYHKLTLYVGDPDENGEPINWDWNMLEIAYLVECVECVEVEAKDTPFDPDVMAELEFEESQGGLL